MPRPRLTEQQQREKALRIAIARAQIEQGIEYDKDVARRIGMDGVSYCTYKQGAFQRVRFEIICKMARELHFTPQEWCAAAGIPFSQEPGG